MKRRWMGGLVVLSLWIGTLAWGAEESTDQTKPKKILRFDSLTITGEAAKPQVFYLLNRKKILLGHEPVKRDALPLLEKSVEGDPF